MIESIVQPIDLEMQVQVARELGGTRLSFTLHSPNRAVAFHHYLIPGPILRSSPGEFQLSLLQRISKLQSHQDVDGSILLKNEVEAALASIGRDLWRELFPLEMQRAYKSFRQNVSTWMIVSDEPWIPWELIKPYDDSNPQEVIDDDFICLRFQLTRWMSGSIAPAGNLPVRVLACIAPDDPEHELLPNAKLEKALVSSIASNHKGISDASGRGITIKEVTDIFRQGVDLIHFITHNQTEPESGLLLADGSFLRPLNLSGPLQTQMASRRSFVFINAPDSGDPSWAHLWITRLKAGAFIAPSWPTGDSEAFEFAKALYENISAGETLGAACQKARRQLQAIDPSDPAFLAYRIYAHPNGRLLFNNEDDAMSAESRSIPNPSDHPALTHSVGQISGAASDRVAHEDQLGFHLYVESFADLIESPFTQLPLTVGIFGSWGMGKSFLLEHLARRISVRQNAYSSGQQSKSRFRRARIFFEKLTLRHRNPAKEEKIPHVHVINFNAWEYSASDAIWPGLVRKVMNRLEREVRWPWPGRFLIKLGWNSKQLFREERGRIIVISYLAVATIVAMIVHLISGESLRDILAALLAVGTLGGILKLVADTLANPISQWITSLFQGKDYGRHVGQFARIRGDLEFLERQLRTSEERILVLIDDLDRCEPDKAVEMLQAIKLLLDFETFIIFLGIDARVVTRAVERHYRGILTDAGASGYEYLDKIVQIPFRIPIPENAEIEVFLSDLMGSPIPTFPTATVASSAPGNSDPTNSPMPKAEAPPVRAEAPPPLAPRPSGGEELRSFSYEELQAFKNLSPFLKRNPRHLKRLVNIYRLIRTLATRSGSALLDRPGPGPIICWVVLCSQWPYTSYLMLRRFEELLRRMEQRGDFPTQSPLPYLLEAALQGIDPRQRAMLDHDPDLLPRLVNEAAEARMSWEDLRLIRRYTINFNPAIEFEEFIKFPAKPDEAAG
ncbi:MAG TPA: P-loop NTPase fold protein [Thermoanaerobaculia bacterium]